MTKEILSVQEFSDYSGLSTSHIYKLTHGRKIAFYRPTGKVIFFKKSEIDNFLLQNRQMTKLEIEAKANEFSLNRNSKK